MYFAGAHTCIASTFAKKMKYALIVLLFSLSLAASEPKGVELNGVFSPDLDKIRAFYEHTTKVEEYGEEFRKQIIDGMVEAIDDSKMKLEIEFPHVVYMNEGTKREGQVTKYSDGLFLLEFNDGLVLPGYLNTAAQTLILYSYEWKRSEPDGAGQPDNPPVKL